MKKIIAVAASALFMTGAFAQASAPAGASAPMAAPSHAAPSKATQVEKQIKDLHAKLKITSAEEDQWGKVADAMRDSATQMDALIAKRRSDTGTMTAVDYLNSYGEFAQTHADGVKKVSAAFEPLYTSMPDAQKKLADSVFAQGAQRHDAKAKAKAK
jgi:cytochrome c-type biogenesis protein CcmH/NrfG